MAIVQYDYTIAMANDVARREERQIMIDLLKIEPGQMVVDVPAWLGYLADGIPDPDRVICIEPRADFAALIKQTLMVHCAPLSQLPLPSNHVDCVGSAVGLHHLPNRSAFLREAVRILKPGGRLCISEVLVGTQVAAFLNGAVNRYCWTGHFGEFLMPGEASELLRAAKCVDLLERQCSLRWRFSSLVEMGAFCQSLLRMQRGSDSEVIQAIMDGFDLEIGSDGSVALPWSLVYAVGSKPFA